MRDASEMKSWQPWFKRRAEHRAVWGHIAAAQFGAMQSRRVDADVAAHREWMNYDNAAELQADCNGEMYTPAEMAAYNQRMYELTGSDQFRQRWSDPLRMSSAELQAVNARQGVSAG